MIRIIKSADFSISSISINAVSADISLAVAEIINAVVSGGDNALIELTKRFDGCDLDSLEVTLDEMDAAVKAAGEDFIGIMQRAASNIDAFHRHQIRQGFVMTSDDGVVLGQRILPISRAGLYIPGGKAAYPSTVLMNCIPAKIAGVEEIIIATPPSKDGSVDAGILAAARIAGADRVFKIGGAQAIAAMAYGTQTIPKVDKITGPGNAYVAEAKRQVFGIVGIDMIAGPSDILVIADGKADPVLVAADMLSQCEHGEDSIAILVTDNEALGIQVAHEIEAQLSTLVREGIARESVDNNGMIIIADSIEQAFDIANELAPEHLEIFLDEPFSYLGRVKNAGSVFLGKNTPEALGDYFAGPNHTIPTAGTALFSSPLSVDDFVKKTSFTYYSSDALRKAAEDVIRFAEKEGLHAHASSVLKRLT